MFMERPRAAFSRSMPIDVCQSQMLDGLGFLLFSA